MKVRIEDYCTGCGICADCCPDVFKICKIKAMVLCDPLLPEQEDTILQIAEDCPAEAISVE